MAGRRSCWTSRHRATPRSGSAPRKPPCADGVRAPRGTGA
jgi:hypothetical protein